MSKRWASDDDANSLLAGILDETEDVARAERERIEAEREAQREAERRANEQERQRQQAEAAARLEAEQERLRNAEKRRTQKLEALRVEDLKERGEWIDPEEVARAEAAEAARREAEADRARRERALEQVALENAQREHAAVADAHPRPASRGLMAATAFLLAALIATGAVLVVALGGYSPDAATYSKTVFAPRETGLALLEARSTPIPTAKAEAIPEPAQRVRTRPKPAVKKPKVADDAAAKRAAELQRMLENSDSVFGE